jgi:acyl dehydratase
MQVRVGPSSVIDDESQDAHTILTKDDAPNHRSDEAARLLGYKGRVVSASLILSREHVLSEFAYAMNAEIASKDTRFHNPMYIGDSLGLEDEILAVRTNRAGPSSGLVFLRRNVLNQDGVLVKEYKRLTMSVVTEATFQALKELEDHT